MPSSPENCHGLKTVVGSTPTPIVFIIMELTEYFCEKCRRVWHAERGNCCGNVVEFDFDKHGRSLIAKANSWGDIEKSMLDFESHPLYREAFKEFSDCGNSSLSGIILLFIDKLIKNSK